MTQWQPIETAPKDGSTIILYVPAVRFRAYWDADLQAFITTRQIIIDRVHDATHWVSEGAMPLEPPA